MSLNHLEKQRLSSGHRMRHTESAAVHFTQSGPQELCAGESNAGRSMIRSAIDRLGPQEIRRRLWHIMPGILPFFLWFIPHSHPLPGWIRASIVVWAVVLPLFAFLAHHAIRRAGEHSIMPSIVGYAAPVVALLQVFPEHPELGLSALAILAFGDGSATLAGLLCPSAPLPWNPEKTWSGFVAFLGCAIPMASLVYWGEALPRMSFSLIVFCMTPAVTIAAVAESVRSRINDNIRVGIAAMLTVLAAKTMLGGWPS